MESSVVDAQALHKYWQRGLLRKLQFGFFDPKSEGIMFIRKYGNFLLHTDNFRDYLQFHECQSICKIREVLAHKNYLPYSMLLFYACRPRVISAEVSKEIVDPLIDSVLWLYNNTINLHSKQSMYNNNIIYACNALIP